MSLQIIVKLMTLKIVIISLKAGIELLMDIIYLINKIRLISKALTVIRKMVQLVNKVMVQIVIFKVGMVA